MIKQLTRLANHLDSKGHEEEADRLDKIINKLADERGGESAFHMHLAEQDGSRNDFINALTKLVDTNNNGKVDPGEIEALGESLIEKEVLAHGISKEDAIIELTQWANSKTEGIIT